MTGGIDRPKFDFARRRKCSEIVLRVPIFAWSNRTPAKSAATIGTHILQQVLYTRSAEGAFEAADHRLNRVRRKRGVAILASGSEFEHGFLGG